MKAKYFLPTLFGLFIAFMTACSSEAVEPVTPGGDEPTVPAAEMMPWEMTDTERKTATIQHDFQMNMFRDVLSSCFNSKSSANFSFSPLNASFALSLMANTTDKPTQEKIMSLMNCDNIGDLNAFNANLYKYMRQETAGHIVDIANGVWFKQDLDILDSYSKTMQEFFDCTPVAVDFSLEDTQHLINAWASENTHGLISEIASDKNCNKLTELFLASALYYKGAWREPFFETDTEKMIFHGINGDKEVDMMHQHIDGFAWLKHNGADGFIKAFKEGVVMIVILPPEGSDIIEFAKQFDVNKLNQMIQNYEPGDVNLYLPRFIVKSYANLTGYMESKQISTKDFSIEGAVKNKSVKAFGMEQQTYLDVNEKGAELAAITSGGSTSLPPLGDFRVDRPFIYIIRDANTSSILMMGLIRDI